MRFQEIHSAPGWRCLDFISDVHLSPQDQDTFAAWARYMQQCDADALFILGDLFDTWVGDDVLTQEPTSDDADTPFLTMERAAVALIRACSDHRPVYVMHGNRDFLMGSEFSHQSGTTMIADPACLGLAGVRYLLSHGDALCLSDHAYQVFRRQARQQAWQQQFLTQPLVQRRSQARAMRQASEVRKEQLSATETPWADVDSQAVLRWMDEANCTHFIHGHTHEGCDHSLMSAGGSGVRYVLPDWHVGGQSARGFALRLKVCGPNEIMTERISVCDQ